MLSLALILASQLFDARSVDRKGVPAGWELRVNKGTPRVLAARDGETRAICLDSNRSSFSIQRSVDVDLNVTPFVEWRWRAEALPPQGDFRESSRDDQAAQLFVAFGRRAINYIWDTNAPVEATGNYDAFVIMIKTVVVESGPTHLNTWVTMRRNVGDDYRRLFGSSPPHVSGVRFQVNSQHTKSRARGCISSIRFE